MEKRVIAKLCSYLIVISSCLTSSLAQAPFQPEEKENPLNFSFPVPKERIDESTYAPLPLKLALPHMDGYFCCKERIIEPFNRPPKAYMSTGPGQSRPEISPYYINQVDELASEAKDSILNNCLKLVQWNQMVNFYNKNLQFRKLLLGGRPLVHIGNSLKEWDQKYHANDMYFFGLNASLPNSVPAPNLSDFHDIFASARLYDALNGQFLNYRFSSRHISCQAGESALDCLKQRFQGVNELFKIMEDIIDYTRKELSQSERDGRYARLFNPVARWFS